MNLVFNCLCLLLLIPVAIYAIPGDVRALIGENCLNSKELIRRELADHKGLPSEDMGRVIV